MSEKPSSQKFTIIFVIAGIIIFQMFANQLFPSTGGYNSQRTIAAAVVGGVCGGLGYLIDSLLSKKE